MPGTVLKPQVAGAFEHLPRPNIIGNTRGAVSSSVSETTNGAFVTYPGNPQFRVTTNPDTGSLMSATNYGISLSLGNSIYSGETLQPPACQTLMIIKV